MIFKKQLKRVKNQVKTDELQDYSEYLFKCEGELESLHPARYVTCIEKKKKDQEKLNAFWNQCQQDVFSQFDIPIEKQKFRNCVEERKQWWKEYQQKWHQE